MNEDDLLARVVQTNFDYLAVGNERFEAHGAAFVRNHKTPRRHDANGLGLIRAGSDAEIDALLRRFEHEFEGFDALSLSADPLTPQRFLARLLLDDGYRHNEFLVLLLEGKITGPPQEHEIREVLSEEDWAAYRELDRLWWLETSTGADQLGAYDPGLHEEFMLSKRLKQPLIRSWLACVDGEPRAFFSSFPGNNGIGMVEDLFCHPDYRHRGLATALLAHCAADARERGAGPVLITSDPYDTPKRMYAALGFRPFCLLRTYTKKLNPPQQQQGP